ncbi:sulfate ABC transporter permease subunit CysT [Pseudonocardia sp.]|uniref:sulfate ABC transporter permease subunit CysT n=1 Tax=Pseudonocardia sp. TaxID=60912 RepID=UPI003D13F2A6
MSAPVLEKAGPPPAGPTPPAPPRRRRRPGSAGPLSLGIATLWLSLIVLLPLAAIAAKSVEDGLAAFWAAITSEAALDAFRITIWVSLVVAAINLLLGLVVAWVLVRDDFPGRRFVDAIIDLPFALPTIVASIVLLGLYGPNSPVGIHLSATQPALVIALLFVTLPFAVRQVQPVLIELERDVEEAAASLGAHNLTIFFRVILPGLVPALLTGAGLAFTRAIGEFGSIVLVGGNIPGETQVASQLIQQQIEIDAPVNAAAISVVLLLIAFVALTVLRLVSTRALRRGGGRA